MFNQQLPFCFTLLSCSSSPAFRNGQIISTLNKCGLFLCHRGEIEISLENKPYLIRHGDIYIYQPSTLVRLLHKSEDAEGTIIEVDLDYVIPIANKVINAENLLFMRKHPCASLSEEQYVHITNLLENIENRIKSENKAEMNMQRQHLMQELIKSMGQTFCYEILNAYFTNLPLQPLPQDKKDLIFQNFMLSLSAPTARNAMSTITQRNNIFLPVTSQASSRKNQVAVLPTGLYRWSLQKRNSYLKVRT